MELCNGSYRDISEAFTHKKAKEICGLIRSGEYCWIPDALLSLDKCNDIEGNTALHMTIDNGNN